MPPSLPPPLAHFRPPRRPRLSPLCASIRIDSSRSSSSDGGNPSPPPQPPPIRRTGSRNAAEKEWQATPGLAAYRLLTDDYEEEFPLPPPSPLPPAPLAHDFFPPSMLNDTAADTAVDVAADAAVEAVTDTQRPSLPLPKIPTEKQLRIRRLKQFGNWALTATAIRRARRRHPIPTDEPFPIRRINTNPNEATPVYTPSDYIRYTKPRIWKITQSASWPPPPLKKNKNTSAESAADGKLATDPKDESSSTPTTEISDRPKRDANGESKAVTLPPIQDRTRGSPMLVREAIISGYPPSPGSRRELHTRSSNRVGCPTIRHHFFEGPGPRPPPLVGQAAVAVAIPAVVELTPPKNPIIRYIPVNPSKHEWHPPAYFPDGKTVHPDAVKMWWWQPPPVPPRPPRLKKYILSHPTPTELRKPLLLPITLTTTVKYYFVRDDSVVGSLHHRNFERLPQELGEDGGGAGGKGQRSVSEGILVASARIPEARWQGQSVPVGTKDDKDDQGGPGGSDDLWGLPRDAKTPFARNAKIDSVLEAFGSVLKRDEEKRERRKAYAAWVREVGSAIWAEQPENQETVEESDTAKEGHEGQEALEEVVAGSDTAKEGREGHEGQEALEEVVAGSDTAKEAQAVLEEITVESDRRKKGGRSRRRKREVSG